MTGLSPPRKRSRPTKSVPCYLAISSSQSFQLTLVNIHQYYLRANLGPNLEAPEEEYEIEYVYGFRTFDSR